MSNKQQTAVEWLEDKFAQYVMYADGHFKAKPYTLTELYDDFHKAKEIEKRQMIDAYNQDLYGGLSNNRKFENGEQYYKENYGND